MNENELKKAFEELENLFDSLVIGDGEDAVGGAGHYGDLVFGVVGRAVKLPRLFGDVTILYAGRAGGLAGAEEQTEI